MLHSLRKDMFNLILETSPPNSMELFSLRVSMGSYSQYAGFQGFFGSILKLGLDVFRKRYNINIYLFQLKIKIKWKIKISLIYLLINYPSNFCFALSIETTGTKLEECGTILALIWQSEGVESQESLGSRIGLLSVRLGKLFWKSQRLVEQDDFQPVLAVRSISSLRSQIFIP